MPVIPSQHAFIENNMGGFSLGRSRHLAHLTLSILGSYDAILDNCTQVRFESNKPRALLAYLAVESQRPHNREALAAMFWPDLSHSAAMANLRNALSKLRQQLNDRESSNPFLVTDRNTVQFNPFSDYELDCLEFERLFQSENLYAKNYDQQFLNIYQYPLTLAQYERMLEKYRGPFLEGIPIPDSIFFEEWVLVRREQIDRMAVTACQRLVDGYTIQKKYEKALSFAWNILQIEPWLEETHQQVMRLLAYSGSRSAALAQYQDCHEILEQELGVEPSPETTRLYEQIQDQTLSSPPDLPVFITQEKDAPPARTMFVAREAALDHLGQALERTRKGQGQVVFVSGSPGQGKTALVNEFIQRSVKEDPSLIAAQGSCQAYYGEGDPYHPFREILKMLIGEVEDHWEAGSISSDHACRLWSSSFRTIEVLVNKGASLIETFIPIEPLRRRASQFTISTTPGWVRQLDELSNYHQRPGGKQTFIAENLIHQYIVVLRTIAKHTPLLIFIDDLQWIDSGSLNLLFNLGKRIIDSPILVIGAFRSEEVLFPREDMPHPLADLVTEFQIMYWDMVVNLNDLEEPELVDAYLDLQPNRLDRNFRNQLFEHTRGHPLYTLELVRGLKERGDIYQNPDRKWDAHPTIQWDVLPQKVEAAIAERIRKLPENLLRILQTASVEGEKFSTAVVADINQEDEESLVGMLSEELDRKYQLVRADSLAHVNERRVFTYRFRHILFQRYLYQDLDAVNKALLHEKVGQSMERIYGERFEQVAGQLAYHFEKALYLEKAVLYLTMAGAQAMHLAAYPDALAHIHHALQLTPAGNIADRFKLILECLKVYQRTRRLDEEQSTIQKLEILALNLTAYEQAEVALYKARFHLQKWDLPAFLSAANQACELAQTPHQEAAGLTFLALHNEYGLGPQSGSSYWEQAMAVADRCNSSDLYIDMISSISAALRFLDPIPSLALAEKALNLSMKTGDQYNEGRIRLAMATVQYELGDHVQSINNCRRAMQICRQVGNHLDAHHALVHLGYNYLLKGNPSEVLDTEFIEDLEYLDPVEHRNLFMYSLVSVGTGYWLSRDYSKAYDYFQKTIKLIEDSDTEPILEGGSRSYFGHLLTEMGRIEEARSQYQKAIHTFMHPPVHVYIHGALAGLARLELHQEEFEEALEYVEQCLPYLDQSDIIHHDVLLLWDYLTAIQVLNEFNDPRADRRLTEAHRKVQECAAHIQDDEFRRSFLAVDYNQEIMRLWDIRQKRLEG